MKKHWPKKHIVLLSVCVLVLLIAIGSVATWMYRSSQAIYKRINIAESALVDEAKNAVTSETNVKVTLTDKFSDIMPVLEITPRKISEDDFVKFAEELNIRGTINKRSDGSMGIVSEEGMLVLEGNELQYTKSAHVETAMTQSDEEIVEEAEKIFESFALFDGEYQCMGVQSTQTARSATKLEDGTVEVGEEYVISKRVGFRRVIEGYRVLGDEQYSFYFDTEGLYSIRVVLFDYQKVGELPMLTLEQAISKVKSPDNFSIEDSFSGHADLLIVERVNLLFVNQYSDGCTILQPVFNLMGTAENETGKAEFSSKVIAIPEKYTYTE